MYFSGGDAKLIGDQAEFSSTVHRRILPPDRSYAPPRNYVGITGSLTRAARFPVNVPRWIKITTNDSRLSGESSRLELLLRVSARSGVARDHPPCRQCCTTSISLLSAEQRSKHFFHGTIFITCPISIRERFEIYREFNRSIEG